MGFSLLACRINMSLMLRINSTVFIYGYNTKCIHTVLVCITESWKVGREYGVVSKDWTTGGSQFSPSTVWFPETGCEFSGLASTLPSQLVPGLQFQSVWNVSGKPEAGWLRMAAHACNPSHWTMNWKITRTRSACSTEGVLDGLGYENLSRSRGGQNNLTMSHKVAPAYV